jgi:hypothetical protein
VERELTWRVVGEGMWQEGGGQHACDVGSCSIRDRAKNKNECKQRETTQKKGAYMAGVWTEGALRRMRWRAVQ